MRADEGRRGVIWLFAFRVRIHNNDGHGGDAAQHEPIGEKMLWGGDKAAFHSLFGPFIILCEYQRDCQTSKRRRDVLILWTMIPARVRWEILFPCRERTILPPNIKDSINNFAVREHIPLTEALSDVLFSLTQLVALHLWGSIRLMKVTILLLTLMVRNSCCARVFVRHQECSLGSLVSRTFREGVELLLNFCPVFLGISSYCTKVQHLAT